MFKDLQLSWERPGCLGLQLLHSWGGQLGSGKVLTLPQILPLPDIRVLGVRWWFPSTYLVSLPTLPLGICMSLAHCLSALHHSMQSSIYRCDCPNFSCGVDTSGRAATSNESQSLSPEQEEISPHLLSRFDGDL